MKIRLDFDDVMVDTLEFKHVYFQKEGVSVEDQDRYLEVKKMLYRDLEASMNFLKFRVGALAGIQRLLEIGFDLKVVTQRGEVESEVARRLLNKVGMSLEIISVGQNNSKLPYLTDCDAFVDDDPKNLLEAIDLVDKLFLMTTVENIEFNHEKIIRVNSWNELVDLLLSEQ